MPGPQLTSLSLSGPLLTQCVLLPWEPQRGSTWVPRGQLRPYQEGCGLGMGGRLALCAFLGPRVKVCERSAPAHSEATPTHLWTPWLCFPFLRVFICFTNCCKIKELGAPQDKGLRSRVCPCGRRKGCVRHGCAGGPRTSWSRWCPQPWLWVVSHLPSQALPAESLMAQLLGRGVCEASCLEPSAPGHLNRDV